MIRLSGIEKQFGGKPVLKGIGLAMAAGSVTEVEIHNEHRAIDIVVP